jgi:hypothetical protein
MPYEFKVGDRVVKNEKTWVVNAFEGWGRGIGVGLVVGAPSGLDNFMSVDVYWPNSHCCKQIEGLLPAPDTEVAQANE